MISEFLSKYPNEKHTTCVLGLILIGISSIKSYKIDYENILKQIESRKSLTDTILSPTLFKPRVSHENSPVSPKIKPEDTPRFLIIDQKPEIPTQNLLENQYFFPPRHPNSEYSKKPVLRQKKASSISNSIVASEHFSSENSDLLKIADSFLNGKFVSEYCNPSSPQLKSQIPKLGLNREVNLSKDNEILTKQSQGSNALSASISKSIDSFSSRHKSISFLSKKVFPKGHRKASYSKFW